MWHFVLRQLVTKSNEQIQVAQNCDTNIALVLEIIQREIKYACCSQEAQSERHRTDQRIGRGEVLTTQVYSHFTDEGSGTLKTIEFAQNLPAGGIVQIKMRNSILRLCFFWSIHLSHIKLQDLI